MTETDLQNKIRLSLSDIAVTFRANVGKFYTADGRVINSGLPVGFPDLFGFRKSDGKMFFIEVKLPNGKLSPGQEKFSVFAKQHKILYGVARSIEQAREIICSI